LLAPVLVGTVAGCGGLFLPPDRCRWPLEHGVPWPVQSAAYAAALYWYLTAEPANG
ncbi:unnamed protein product, partial [Phaeothamnion confervicola]